MNGAYHFPYFVTKEFKEGNRDLIDESLLGDSSFTPQLRALKKLFSKKTHPRGKFRKHYTSRVLYISFYGLRQPICTTCTPSARRVANLPPVRIINKSGSRIGFCFSVRLCSIISSFSCNKCFAPSSIALLPNLHSIKAYLPSDKCNTTSASKS